LQVGTIRRIATVAIIIAAPCAAQSAASLAINAGNATDVTGVGSSALTIAPSFTRASGLSSATIGASATKFANDAWSAGLSTALNGRASSGSITPAIDLAMNAATTSYDFSYASADLIPSLEMKVGAAKIFGGARLAAAGSSSNLGAPVGPIPAASRSTTSKTATTAIGGLSFSAVSTAGQVASIGYRGETGTVAGVVQVDQTLNGAIANSKLIVAASVGRRDRSSESSMHGSATLGVAMTPVVMLQLSAGNYASNAMLGTAAGKFVNAGLSMRIGRTPGAMPAPANIPAPARGRTRVAIRAAGARSVELAGDFNKWQLLAATRADNGVWYVDLDLPAGEYRYAFRVDGKEWRVPEGVAAADDEFGGKSAWLRVSRPASK
jgi:hypothetical protein